MLDVKKIKKNNNNAIFLGCGPSINDLDPSFLKGKDVWASNNFIIHPEIVPDFYHLELKEHRNGPTFRKLLNEKKEKYLNVKWILNKQRPYLFNSVNPNIFKNIFLYENIPVYCMSSISIILQIMISLNYDNIYVSGVDLYNCEYFWTYNNKEIPDIIKTCKPDERNPDTLHPTQERNIANFIKDLNIMNKTNIINISKKSLLKNYIESQFK